jgi:hypothetical protein
MRRFVLAGNAFGDVQFLGSMGGRPLNAPLIGVVSHPAQDPVFSWSKEKT